MQFNRSTTTKGNTVSVRCKFIVQSVTRSKNWDKSKPDLYSVKLGVVTSGSPENAAFYAATPGGTIEFTSINESAALSLPLGEEVYVDITPATAQALAA